MQAPSVMLGEVAEAAPALSPPRGAGWSSRSDRLRQRNWDAFLGRQIPLKEDCLTCRFPHPQLLGEPALVCGSGTLPVVPEAGTPATATLSFIPTAAAVMTVAELVKTALPDYPRNVNFGCLDFLGSLSDFLPVPRVRSAGGICEGQRELWRQVNAATTFAGPSDE